MKPDFSNTEIAFAHRSNFNLIRAFNIYQLINKDWLVRMGTGVAVRAMKWGIRLPISAAAKPTIYSLFVGGQTLEKARPRMEKMAALGVDTILDYGVEASESEKDFERTAAEVRRALEFARDHDYVKIVSSKFTGMISFGILEKLHEGKPLTDREESDWTKARERITSICALADEYSVSLFVDAEESWIQIPLDDLVHSMMKIHNREKPIIYNTAQMYRRDRLDFLKKAHAQAIREGYIYAVKLVRGAYMEKERERALKKGYDDPIHKDKAACDLDYNEALRYCLENVDTMAVCIATHNEQSCMNAVEIMAELGISCANPHIQFSQLLGMSDHISFNLGQAGYNVGKFTPYGPVREVIPYLLRRAEENTSVSGQMSRELRLIQTELKRRRLIGF